jgi:hypothetical protein
MAETNFTPREQTNWRMKELVRECLLEACGDTLKGMGVDTAPLQTMTPLPDCMKAPDKAGKLG